ncbi:MAG: hypothetical protein ABIP46_08700 [Polaromonas sp.]
MSKTAATKTAKANTDSKDSGVPASQLIDEKIANLNDWRGEMLARLRTLVKQAVPEVVEESKWWPRVRSGLRGPGKRVRQSSLRGNEQAQVTGFNGVF